MKGLDKTDRGKQLAAQEEPLWPVPDRQRPSFRWSDIWKAPLHDFPIRDEILYQYLPLSSDMEVLEIGPGSGFTAFRVSRRVRNLILVDVTAANVDQLWQRLKQVRNVRVVQGDVCAPGLAQAVGAEFDAIVGLEVFEYLEDPKSCLKNLARLLRPGGRLLLEFPNYPPPKNPGVTCFRTRGELGNLLRAAGFEKWEMYALRLKPYAHFLFRQFHERALRAYRRWRNRNGLERAMTYENTWAFKNEGRLEPYRYLLHLAWAFLMAGTRLGGDCFERRLLGEEILNHDILLLARR
jgi:SAM-dependent methyltransferase